MEKLKIKRKFALNTSIPPREAIHPSSTSLTKECFCALTTGQGDICTRSSHT